MRGIVPGKGVVFTAPMNPVQDEDGKWYLMVDGPLTFTPDPTVE